MELKAHRIIPPVPTAPKIEYVVPPEMQTRMAFLGQENERLNAVIIDLQNKSKTQAPVVEYIVNPEMQTRMAFLGQENERLNAVII